MACQLDFFPSDEGNLDHIKIEIKNVKESTDKVRKSLFARHAELMKKYLDLSDRMQIIERNICQK
jgi:hypothetical protein